MSPDPASPSALSWADVERFARSLPARHNLVVPKSVLPNLPPHRPSWLGRRRGALKQYRCDQPGQNLHIKEYSDRWVVHVDRWNPHKKPFRHLLVDRGFRTFVALEAILAAPQPVPVPA